MGNANTPDYLFLVTLRVQPLLAERMYGIAYVYKYIYIYLQHWVQGFFPMQGRSMSP